MRSLARPIFLAVSLGTALVVGGCASSSDKEKAEFAFTEEPPEKLYNEGLAQVNSGNFSSAAKKFEEVDKQAPYSEWARKAQVMTTFAYYRAGKYDDAIQAGRRYVGLHPSAEDAPYVWYLVAQSYYRQLPDITRDQRDTERALAVMEEMVRRYPDSEYTPDISRKIEEARDQLAGKEMQIGRYYLERRDYIGAINRFRTVISQYQTTRHVEEALERLVEAYLAMGVVSEAQTAAAVLGHNYPDSPWYKDAYTLLQSGGHEPRENTGSWISRAFRRIVPG